MLIASMLLVALHTAQPATPIRVTAVGDCIPGPHEAGRVRRLPGQAMTSHKPRDPSEDGAPHCTGPVTGPRARTGDVPVKPARPAPGRKG